MTRKNPDGEPYGYWINVARKNGICDDTYRYRKYTAGWSSERAATEPVAPMQKVLTHHDDARILQELDEGLGVTAVAKMFGVAYMTVKRRIKWREEGRL